MSDSPQNQLQSNTEELIDRRTHLEGAKARPVYDLHQMTNLQKMFQVTSSISKQCSCGYQLAPRYTVPAKCQLHHPPAKIRTPFVKREEAEQVTVQIMLHSNSCVANVTRGNGERGTLKVCTWRP